MTGHETLKTRVFRSIRRLTVLSALALVVAMLVVADRTGYRHQPAAPATAAPDQVHLSWVTDTATTMAVTWRTAGAANTLYTVQWGPSSGDYSSGQVAATSSEAPGGRGILHKALISGLQPDTPYHYRVAGDNGRWSGDHTFRTAPAALPDSGVMFTINGDVGDSYRHPNAGAVLDRIAREDAAFHLIAGDIIYGDETFGTATEAYFFAKDLPRVAARRPVLVAWGNHEYRHGSGLAEGVSIESVSRYFQLPSGQANGCNPSPYYSFDYAGIHLVALDDPDPANTCYDRAAMRAWLDRDLARAAFDPAIRWKVVFLHRPPFSGGAHGSSIGNRFQEFDTYGVDLVVAAHDHNYERTWPVSWDGTHIGDSYERPAYPAYIVAGTGGAPTTAAWTPNPWSAFHDGGKHVGYLRVTANGSTLKGEFVGRPAATGDAAFSVLDSFTIRKGATGNGLP
jgi:hypothetical protein